MHQEVDEEGVAHFLEHLMFKGSHKNSGYDIQNRMSLLGGRMNASTDSDNTTYQVHVLKENFSHAATLLATMLLGDHLSISDIEFEKSIVLEELRSRGGSWSVFSEGFYEAAYGDHPIAGAIIGTKESVENIDSFKILTFREKFYTGKNLTIAVAGDLVADEVFDALEGSFGNLPAGEKSSFEKLNYIGGEAHFPCPCENGIVQLGFSIGEMSLEKAPLANITDEILGGGPNSRLFREIRETRGLAYETYSRVQVNGNDTLLMLYADCHSSKTKDVFQIMCEQVDALSNTLDQEELDMAKRSIIAEERMYRDYLNSRTEFALQDYSDFGLVEPTQDKINAIEAITTDQVSTFVREMVAREPTLAVHGTVRNMPKLRDFKFNSKSDSLVA